jgi:pimeloyl-ACP methyl ester carboxylesterase
MQVMRRHWTGWAMYTFGAIVVVIACSGMVEFLLETRDATLLMTGQTFATVGRARIRYWLAGTENHAAQVVILPGISSGIEQVDDLQRALSAKVPTLSYDRAGYGFSENSTAHTAEEQAEELAALLHALKLEAPVVLVAYSASGPIARIFASHYPESVAAMYLLEPTIPESGPAMPWLHGPRRVIARSVLRDLLASSLGYTRLVERFRNPGGPASPVEQRLEAIVVRRPHSWALVREWYMLEESWRQTLAATLPSAMRLHVVTSNNEFSAQFAKLYAELAARSSRGHFVELKYPVEHSRLTKPGPDFDAIVSGIEDLALEGDIPNRGTLP